MIVPRSSSCKSTTASPLAKATGAVSLSIGSVVSMVGTSPVNVLIANADLNVGTKVLNRKMAEHNPPTAGSASGRIK